MNTWQAKKAEITNRKADLQRKTQGLKSGQSRTLIQGKNADNYDSEGPELKPGESWTSPDAKDYLKPTWSWTSPDAKDYLK